MPEMFNTNIAAAAGSDNQYGNGPLGNIAKGGKVSAKDEFWDYAEIDETHWNKSYPYQLVVLRRDGTSYVTTDKFTLPINPTELSISSPFAITTTVTLGGIVEEHNGSPLKMISIQGTTGFFPLKGSPDVSQSLGSSIFAGSLSGTRGIGAGVRQIVSGGFRGEPPNLVKDSDLNHGTGYYQFLLLRNFLESYVALKKTAEGAPYRLAFVVWKDTESWLVTPVSFDLKRSASSAMEYMYSIQLKAWKRYSPGRKEAPTEFTHKPVVRSPNAMASALNSFRGARSVLLGARSVLTGFRADVDAVLFSPLRETGMFLKDAIGVGLTAADLPFQIIQDAKNSIIQLVSTVQEIRKIEVNAASWANELEWEAIKSLGVITGIAENRADPYAHRSYPATGPTGGSSSSSSQGGLTADLSALGPNRAHPANRFFADPDKYLSLFDGIQLGSLSLKPAVVKKVVQERERIQKLTRADFERFRDGVVALAADYADFVGAGGATFATIYNRPAPTVTATPTDDDWDVLFALNQTAMEYDRLAASTATDTRNKLTAMEYLAGQAQRSGIPFKIPLSAFSIPFPYGSTLEVISGRYLGTPDRWHEIATLNNLRPPYVDEEGFSLPMLVNGSGNTIQVSDGTNLYLGQTVWLSSSVVSREKRRIATLRRLTATVWVVGLEGEGDLAKFTVASGAELFTFLPGTANSLQLLYLPSDQPPAEPDFEPKGNESLDVFETFLQVGGVDLLLTGRGDLAITTDGDARLSIGLANIIQHVKLVLDIEPGTLLHHPDVGFGVQAGTSTADVDAKDILKAAQATFANDPTFSGIGAASIVKSGASLDISLSLGVNGISHFIPVQFAVRQ